MPRADRQIYLKPSVYSLPGLIRRIEIEISCGSDSRDRDVCTRLQNAQYKIVTMRDVGARAPERSQLEILPVEL
jgi:hypothetical protein